MIKEALQYIIGIQQPKIEEIDGKQYYFQNGNIPTLVDECRDCEAVRLSTLTSLVNYIKNRMADDFPDGIPKMIVHVVSETEVVLLTQFNSDIPITA